MITEEQIRDRVSELKTLNESRLSNYYRNYNYYNNTPAGTLKNIRTLPRFIEESVFDLKKELEYH